MKFSVGTKIIWNDTGVKLTKINYRTKHWRTDFHGGS